MLDIEFGGRSTPAETKLNMCGTVSVQEGENGVGGKRNALTYHDGCKTLSPEIENHMTRANLVTREVTLSHHRMFTGVMGKSKVQFRKKNLSSIFRVNASCDCC